MQTCISSLKDSRIEGAEEAAHLNTINLSELLCILYRRYVDDQMGGHRPTPLGLRWDPINKKMMYSQEWVEEDRDKPPDERTMKLLQAVANFINPRLKMTIDYPTAHVNGRMPIAHPRLRVLGGRVRQDLPLLLQEEHVPANHHPGSISSPNENKESRTHTGNPANPHEVQQESPLG